MPDRKDVTIKAPPAKAGRGVRHKLPPATGIWRDEAGVKHIGRRIDQRPGEVLIEFGTRGTDKHSEYWVPERDWTEI